MSNAIKRNIKYRHINRTVEQVDNSNITSNRQAIKILLIALTVGVVISCFLIICLDDAKWLYNIFTAKKTPNSYTNFDSQSTRANYQETASTADKIYNDFGYPYEDIGETTGR